MLTFPAAIEQSLLDSGLSSTEILILCHLIGGDALSLRQLAMKTGKSTGVLSQAMKKLMRKEIVSRQILNESPCYLLQTLEHVSNWLQQDTRQKENTLLRRHRNFMDFFSTLTRNQDRPDLLHFDEQEGICSAYMKLLALGVNELLCFLPMQYQEEDHPLREFQKHFARERRRRGIFLRVIANDSALGRRYKSRDPFEYRNTALVFEEKLTIPFEYVIAGDAVVCFDHKEQRACLLRYPQLAMISRAMFLSLAGPCPMFPSPLTSPAVRFGQRLSALVRGEIHPDLSQSPLT
ncbi:MAG: helix-turn-helix domain-containing protein [Candidatus Peribacteraceae bacterium]|jgi:DNA-binding HxlR family transcriptional regulator